MTLPERLLPLDGAFNVRDLGGYSTQDGRQIRWRRLFRGDGLHRLTIEDLAALDAVGLRSVIDLRTAHELAERGRFPVEQLPVRFHHLSVLDQTWDHEEAIRQNLSTTEFLHQAYSSMLEVGAPRFAEAIELLAAPEALPAVFHCAAGKDRTGLLAALVLGAVGVERDAIVADYELTEAAMPRFLELGRQDPVVAERQEKMPRSFFAADGPAMRRVVDDLVAAHGSIRNFVREIGVSEATIDELVRLLVTD